MYHEADFEMEQLLQSIAGIDAARRRSERQFESHIFLDDGVRGQVRRALSLPSPCKALCYETIYFAILGVCFSLSRTVEQVGGGLGGQGHLEVQKFNSMPS